MKVWAIGDLHLACSTPEKSMERLVPSWHEYQERIASNWDRLVAPSDLVLIPGDISWAMRLEGALLDLQYIAKRPGVKVMVRGNHDYWWESASKIRKALPEGLHIIQNDVFSCGPVSIAGARLWDSPEYSFSSIIDFKGKSVQQEPSQNKEEDEKIFLRELGRLEMSLKLLPRDASHKIAMTHFPPIGLDLEPTRASALFEKYGVQEVVFGHLHSIKPSIEQLFGASRGVRYTLTSADWLHFQPTLICEVGR